MYGKYKHTVDPKGRLFVPSKLREELGDAFYVTLGLDHCLSVYTEAGWQVILDKYNALPISQARKMRFLFANAAKCEPDKQGRFLIPTELRQYAGIQQEVTFIGQGGHAEIWDSEAYEKLESETLTPENLAARQPQQDLGGLSGRPRRKRARHGGALPCLPRRVADDAARVVFRAGGRAGERVRPARRPFDEPHQA